MERFVGQQRLTSNFSSHLPRSGSWLHVDHRGCFSGWNTLLFGKKKWVFLPPSTDLDKLGLSLASPEKGGTVGRTKSKNGEDSPREDIQCPIRFMTDVLADLRGKSESGEVDGLVEVVQLPGQTVFVPAGWFHCVLNLEVGCAIAESFLPRGQIFEKELWGRLCGQQPAFAHVLRECLAEGSYER